MYKIHIVIHVDFELISKVTVCKHTYLQQTNDQMHVSTHQDMATIVSLLCYGKRAPEEHREKHED